MLKYSTIPTSLTVSELVIYPYNNDIFPDSEFSSSYDTDRPDPAVEMNVDSNCPGPTSTTSLPENNCCPAVSTSANQYKMNVESTCLVPTSHALPDNDCQNASTSANHCEINVELNCPFPTSSESVPESDCLVSSNSANQCELIEESNCPSPTIPAALSRFDNIIATSNNSSRDYLQPTIISSNSYVSPAALLSLPKAPPRKSHRPDDLELGKREFGLGLQKKLHWKGRKKKNNAKSKNALPQNL